MEFNLQRKKQPLINIFYYLRQFLANALILYLEEQKRYIKASHKKTFVANNTLNFYDFPTINELKTKYFVQDKFIILCVGRMNVNNRKFDHLLLADYLKNDKKFIIYFVAPGVSKGQAKKAMELDNFVYNDAIYDRKIMSEIYKNSDIFFMPGDSGLAMNTAFYYGLPVIVEKWNGNYAEIIYFRENETGFYYYSFEDMYLKINKLYEERELYYCFSKNFQKTIIHLFKECPITNLLQFMLWECKAFYF